MRAPRRPPAAARLVAGALACALASGTRAQEPHEAHRAGSWALLPPTASSLAAAREASGTSWEPARSPVPGWHGRVKRLDATLRWNAFLAFSEEPSPRGAADLRGTGWLLAALGRDLGAWRLSARTILSPERWTVGRDGHPLLFEAGGAPGPDRRHPHELVLEAALAARLELSPALAVEAYLAAAGEPALGPTSSLQRLSAAFDPVAPLGHGPLHEPHPAAGVVTFGMVGRSVKLELSGFGAAEPDDRRSEPDRLAVDSGAARLSVALGRSVVAQVSGARLAPGEDEAVRRATASLSWAARVGRRGAAAVTAALGRDGGGGPARRAALVEGSVTTDGLAAVFGRAEWLERSPASLRVAAARPSSAVGVSRLSLGASTALWRGADAVVAAGLRGVLALAPSALEAAYGEGPLAGVALFLELRPPLRRGGGRGGHAGEAWRER